MKEKSERNKTLYMQDISEEEQKRLFNKCIDSLYQLSNCNIVNKTICGNTFEVMPFIPIGSVDLCIVDPPYNLTKAYGEKQNTYHKTSDRQYKRYTEEWVDFVYTLMKENASMYVCCDWQSSPLIYDILKDRFIVQNRITWKRDKGRGSKTNWKNCMEDIWFVTKSKKYTFNADAVKVRKKVLAPYKEDGKPKDWKETPDGNFRDTFPSNFMDDITIPYWSMPENTDHPTQKPEKLIAKLILASSNKGDIILDPFLGSGTTSVVAKKLDRKYIGIEWYKKFYVLAEKRLELASTNKRIQGYENNIFWERNSGK